MGKKTTAQSGAKVTVDALERLVSDGGVGLKSLNELLQRAAVTWQPESERTAARHALRRCFGAILERGELRVKIEQTEDETAALAWLVDRFEAFQDSLIDWCWNDQSTQSERVAALRTLFWFAAREKLLDAEEDVEEAKEITFGRRSLGKFIETACSKPRSKEDLVIRTLRDEFVILYLDFQLHLLRAIKQVAVAQRKKSTQQFVPNVAFLLLSLVPFPHSKALEEEPSMLVQEDTVLKRKLVKVGPLRKGFQDAWLAFLRVPSLKGTTYRSALIRLPDLIPHLSQPLLLSDFLTDAFSFTPSTQGDEDEIPLLALSSLFILVRDYQLDYPHLYDRLYELVRPSLFHADKREKFCELLNASLKSSHLPAYLIASFCKRLARVALFSPPSAGLFALVMVYNLLRRHPNCVFLIHRLAEGKALMPDKEKAEASKLQEIQDMSRRLAMGLKPHAKSKTLAEDPFLADEQDPSKTKSLETSLWEIETLKHHYCPSVASLARSVFAHDLAKDRLTKPELPIGDFIVTYQDLYLQEARLKTKQDQEGNKRIKVDAPLKNKKPSPDSIKSLLLFG